MAKERTGIKPLVKLDKAYEADIHRLLDDLMTTPFVGELNQGYTPERLQTVVTFTTEAVSSRPSLGQDIAQKSLMKMKDSQQKRFKTILKSVQINVDLFGVSVDPAIRNYMVKAVERNVGLITTLSKSYGDRAFKAVEDAVQKYPHDLQKQQEIIHRFLEPTGKDPKWLKNRSRLIARDQNNKLVGDLNQISHQQAGGEEYRWSTSRDARVRTTHAARNGKIFRWSNPPEDGHPGQAIQCRCVAKFIFRSKEEKNRSTVLAPTKELADGRPVYTVEGVNYTPDKAATSSTVNMLVDSRRLNSGWRKNKSQFIGAGDEGIRSAGLDQFGEIVRDADGKVVKASRKHWFKEWRKQNPTTPVEQPWIGVTERGLVDFVNGRHRTSVLINDEKKKAIVVSVARDSVDNAVKQLGGIELGAVKQGVN